MQIYLAKIQLYLKHSSTWNKRKTQAKIQQKKVMMLHLKK